MGSPIAQQIIQSGIKVISPLKNRSSQTRDRAKKFGIEDSGTLNDSINESELIISILIPDAAEELARNVAEASNDLDKEIFFADLNAISPETVINMKNILL